MILCRKLSFSYPGGPPVLEKIDLSIEKGEMVGILGPNGSGKTTLLKLMSGALRPSAGRVLLEGSDISRMAIKEIARKMTVVPQETDLGFDFTVREVVSMGRYPHLGRFQFNDPESERIVRRSMKRMGVLDLAEKSFSQLSGGEKQRVIIARALSQEPELLFLDEPTKNLDVRHSLDIMTLVRRMNIRSGLTVAAVLHDLDLAARYCTRIILLKEGRIYRDGPIESVLNPEIIEQVFDVRTRVRTERGLRVDILD